MRMDMTIVAVLAGVIGCAGVGGAARGAIIPVQSYSNTGNQPYQYLDSGNEMTDGAWSTTGINPIDPWVGYSSAHAQLTFDLGASAPQVASAMVVYCAWTDAAVYLPESVEFRFSDDPNFGTYTSRQFLSPWDGQRSLMTVEMPYSLSGVPAARYVRLSADSPYSWLFLGEVQFNSVPVPSSLVVLSIGAAAGLRRRR